MTPSDDLVRRLRDEILAAYKEHYDFPSQGESHMRDCLDDILEAQFAARAEPQPVATVRAFAQAILHGDEAHRAWLVSAAECFITNRPLPAPPVKAACALGGEQNLAVTLGISTAPLYAGWVFALNHDGQWVTAAEMTDETWRLVKDKGPFIPEIRRTHG